MRLTNQKSCPVQSFTNNFKDIRNQLAQMSLGKVCRLYHTAKYVYVIKHPHFTHQRVVELIRHSPRSHASKIHGVEVYSPQAILYLEHPQGTFHRSGLLPKKVLFVHLPKCQLLMVKLDWVIFRSSKYLPQTLNQKRNLSQAICFNSLIKIILCGLSASPNSSFFIAW